VVVDGDVKSVGKIPTKQDVKKWIQNSTPAKGGCCG